MPEDFSIGAVEPPNQRPKIVASVSPKLPEPEEDFSIGAVEAPKDAEDFSVGAIRPLDALHSFANSQGLRLAGDSKSGVIPTRRGAHNVGSKHYLGQAIDVDYNGVDINALSQAAAAQGFKVRDERTRPKNQKVWGGPHLHIETADDYTPNTPPTGDAVTGASTTSNSYIAGVPAERSIPSPTSEPSAAPASNVSTSSAPNPYLAGFQQAQRALNTQRVADFQMKARPLGVSTNDISWHLGMDADEFKNLSQKQQQDVINLSRKAVAVDEQKKAQGVNLQPSLDYINSNRAALGLAPKSVMSQHGLPAQQDNSSAYDLRPFLKGVATQSFTPQEIEAKRIAAEAPTSFIPALVPAELNRLASKFERGIAGAADYASRLGGSEVTKQISDYLKNRAQIAELASQYETPDVENSLPKSIIKSAADSGTDLVALIAIQRATGLPLPVIMGGEAALNNSDKPAGEIAKQVAIASALGAAYEHVPGLAAKGLGIQGNVPTRVLGASLFGAAGAGQAAYEGGTPNQIISEFASQAGMGALGGEHPEGKPAEAKSSEFQVVPREAATKQTLDYIKRIESEGAITKSQGELLRSNLKASRAVAPNTQPQEAFGPGAANVGDVPQDSTTRQLTEALKNSDTSPRETINYSLNLADKLSSGKDAIERGLTRTRAITQALWAKYKGSTDVSEPQKILGDFQYRLQKSAFETRKFSKELEKTLSPAQQSAITNYIQAGGDNAVLQERANASSGSSKKGYELATKLTDNERTIAQNFSNAFDALFEQANKEGVGVNFIEDYVPQLWASKKAQKVMLAEAQRGILDPSFRFSKKRVFESYFEGEQAGYKPKTKDIGKLYQIYSNSLNNAIASRQYIADLRNAKASDGRPVVSIMGSGKTGMSDGQLAEEKGAFIRPSTKTPVTSDYRVINHPAMRGWKYTTSLDSKPVMLEGQMAIHPEYYAKIKNVLTPSKIMTGEGAGYSVLRGVKKGQSIAKQTMLGFFSPFHQVQEDVHALGHKTLPYVNETRINFDDPQQQRLVKGGLQVASWHDAEAFSEGLAGGNLTARIPGIGTKLLGPYQEWLFKDHIPTLKMDMALHALKRNTERYKGKLSPERIAELTATQANNAFGELNYTYLARNQTFQDSLRMILLAPDFLEARAKFAGSAFKGQGREQLNALLLLAATQYVTARVLNKLSDDDYHLEPENAFRVIHKGKGYGLRSVPSDLLELYEDPRKFLTHRSSPLTAAAIRAYTGKNEFGKPIGLLEQAKLLAESPVPIQLKALSYKKEMSLWDSFFSSMGLRVSNVEAKPKLTKRTNDKKRGRLLF
jgi:hypothetical protein